MQPARRRAHAPPLHHLFCAAATLGAFGCASPGPPHPPSLGLPRAASGVTAVRSGDQVTLRFNLPSLSTDGQPLRDASLRGSLCRQVGSTGACIPIDGEQTRIPLPLYTGQLPTPVIWTDALPPDLRSGPPRAIAYRIELLNTAGRSGGPSDPVFAASGPAPPPIDHFQAEPMRLGIALRWTPQPGAGEVLLDRIGPPPGPTSSPATTAEPKPSSPAIDAKGKKGQRRKAVPSSSRKTPGAEGTPGLLVLQADPGDSGASYTVDATAVEGVPYSYSAFRRQVVQLGGRTLELRSISSPPVTATWRDLYPPAMPGGLTALGYRVRGRARAADAAGNADFAVDLVWQPVNDPRLAGYRVYRQTIGVQGKLIDPRELLAPAPVTTPGFHDSTALPGVRYRYSVTAIDPKGNESLPAQADISPSTPLP